MNDTQFGNMVAQIAHALAGYAAVLTLFVLHVHYAVPIAWVGMTAFAAGKEFWFDYKYESATERGSSFEDFCFYIVGLILGSGIVAAAYFS